MNPCLDMFTVHQVPATPCLSRLSKDLSVRATSSSHIPLSVSMGVARTRAHVLTAGFAALRQARREGVAYASTLPASLARLASGLFLEMPPVDAYLSGEGSLCFDWDEEPDNQLSILVGANHRIAFAAYRHGVRSHGHGQMLDAQLPSEVNNALAGWSQAPSKA